MRNVPRGPRQAQETPESLTLDVVAREYNRTEAKLKALHEQLIDATVKAVEAGMSKSEAARRTGYTREHVSRMVSVRNVVKKKTDP